MLRVQRAELTWLVAGWVAQEGAEHGLYVEGIPAVEAHDHAEVGTAAHLAAGARGRRDAQHAARTVLDALNLKYF